MPALALQHPRLADDRSSRLHRRADCRGNSLWRARLPRPELTRLLAQPDALVWRHLDRPVKISHETLLVEAELPLADGPVHVAYKQFRPRRWWKTLCGRFRRSRARRGWELGRALLARGIATPRPLAACEPRKPWFFRTSYLATEWIAGGENLHLFGWRLADYPAPQRLRLASRCAINLGRLLGRMHAAGVVHRDLKAANLLAAQKHEDVAVYLVDLDGVRIVQRAGAAGGAADLARLAAGLQAHPWLTPASSAGSCGRTSLNFRPGPSPGRPLAPGRPPCAEIHVRRQQRRGRQAL